MRLSVRNLLMCTLTLCVSALVAVAQTSTEEYKHRCERQMQKVGVAGIGVETLLDRWAQAYPEDPSMLEARFNFYLAKARSTQIVKKDQSKYLGNKPVLSLPDSTGKAVNYFEEPQYVDSLFAKAMTIVDGLIASYPYELAYRFDKITALFSYEKDSPDLAKASLMEVLSMQQAKVKPEWTYEGKAISEDFLPDAVQEYCAAFFKLASDNSYKAFRDVSVCMNKMYPKYSVFVDNLGSYSLVVEKNRKKALKYYKKALKLDAEDATAKQNITLIERMEARDKAAKAAK